MGRLAEDLALALAPGDVLALSGDLGAGKSTLARALLRALAGDPNLEVPSPTFTLVQTYDLDRFAVSHFDLYRIEEPEELEELGLDEMLETGAALIEWPERAEGLLPRHAITVRITQDPEGSDRREVRFEPSEASSTALERIGKTLKIRRFLENAGWGEAHRSHLTGDASSRAYERISLAGKTAVLMKSPPMDADPALAEAVAYRRSVHLSLDVRAFVAIGEELRQKGLPAPEILYSDIEAGTLLLEDLGGETVAIDGEPVADRYHEAVSLLAEMHCHDFPENPAYAEGADYRMPVYTPEALLLEAELFLDWYVPYTKGRPASPEETESFRRLWREALSGLTGAETGWVLRDFHSPNLMWREDQQEGRKVWLIDYQDAVLGPLAYDLASLLLDARVPVSRDLEAALYRHYVKEREHSGRPVDEAALASAYAVMGAQRVTKILGIFVRLSERDGKPEYLEHLPRMEDYLRRVLEHPVLNELKLWYDAFEVEAASKGSGDEH